MDSPTLLVLIGVAFILILAVGLAQKRASRTPPERDNSKVINNFENRLHQETPVIKPETLDEQFAKANNLWVCPHCESFNAWESVYCQICGLDRLERTGSVNET